MKRNLLRIALLMIACTLNLTACENIFDGEGDCSVHYRMQFIFDKNMSFVNTLTHEVNDVQLFVFNEDGIFVKTIDANREALKDPDYRLSIDLHPGRYTFVAWSGLQGENLSYSVPQLTPGTSTLQELTCRLQRGHGEDGRAYVYQSDDLFHGICTLDLPDTYGDHYLEMPFTKNTNYVRIVLQHASGAPLNKDDFRFTVTDCNGLMAHDNALLADELIDFRAWSVKQGAADIYARADDNGRLNVVVADITTARLTRRNFPAGEKRYPLLTITKATPEPDGTYRTVLSIPFVDYILLMKSERYKEMSDQEYLDREDTHNLTFFLDDDQNWLSSSIIINSWKLVLSDVEL